MKLSKILIALALAMATAVSLSACTDRSKEQDEQFNPTENQLGPVEEEKPEAQEEEPEDDEDSQEDKIEDKEDSSQEAMAKPAPQVNPPAPPVNPTPYIPPAKPQAPKEINKTYVDTGVYDEDKIIDSALVRGKDIKIANKTINGDLVVDSYANGYLTLSNILVKGKIIVDSPALDRINFQDVQCEDVVLKKVGKYFFSEATGKSILTNLTLKDHATFKEYDLHPSCEGFINITIEPNNNPYGTHIDLTSCDLGTVTVASPSVIKGATPKGARINRAILKANTDVEDGVMIKEAVSYSVGTYFKKEPLYIDYRGRAEEIMGDHKINDYYDDRYKEQLYAPDMIVSNDGGNLLVEFENYDHKTDKIIVKLYIDGRYATSEEARIRTSRSAWVEFVDGDKNGRVDLGNTTKRIEAYAVPKSEQYENSKTLKWHSKPIPEPDAKATTDTITINDFDANKYNYSYSKSLDGKWEEISEAETTDLSLSGTVYVRAELKAPRADSDNYSVISITVS